MCNISMMLRPNVHKFYIDLSYFVSDSYVEYIG